MGIIVIQVLSLLALAGFILQVEHRSFAKQVLFFLKLGILLAFTFSVWFWSLSDSSVASSEAVVVLIFYHFLMFAMLYSAFKRLHEMEEHRRHTYTKARIFLTLSFLAQMIVYTMQCLVYI